MGTSRQKSSIHTEEISCLGSYDGFTRYENGIDKEISTKQESGGTGTQGLLLIHLEQYQ